MSKAHQLIQEDEHYFAKSGRIKYYGSMSNRTDES
ncbi:hypothetical protein U996_02317 [Staphylococcus aureus 1111205429]|nr:hypothetical protein U996_02317 [Staphylococcus aureus 1111205429]